MLKVWVGLEARKYLQASAETVSPSLAALHQDRTGVGEKQLT